MVTQNHINCYGSRHLLPQEIDEIYHIRQVIVSYSAMYT